MFGIVLGAVGHHAQIEVELYRLLALELCDVATKSSREEEENDHGKGIARSDGKG